MIDFKVSDGYFAIMEKSMSSLREISLIPIETTPDGQFPARINRAYEEQLLEVCASGTLELERWAGLGPRFFMAGVAVMLASASAPRRGDLLALAERLHPGASEVAVFNRWLEGSPLRPGRFLPLLEASSRPQGGS